MDFSEKKKQKLIVGLVLLGLVLVVVGLGVFSYLYNNRCFDHYRVDSKVERSDSSNVSYQYYNGNILKYSRSGISEIDNETAAVTVLPNLSARKPPIAFPRATARTKASEKAGTDFQLKSITVPSRERITIVSIKQITAVITAKDGFL